MIDRTHKLPITRQAEALGIARSTVYALPRPVSDHDLDPMKRMDRLHLEMPFAGSRMLRDLLALEGIKVGRRHVRTLMKRMGVEALYRKPRTTRKHPQHPIYPYLLRGLKIDRPNQVWAMDITYIPMARGFVYLTAVVDWFTRRVLAWRVSITMDVYFCIEAVEEAGIFAGFKFYVAVVTAIGHHAQFVHGQGGPGLLRHPSQLPPVTTDVSDLMCHDQMVLRGGLKNSDSPISGFPA